MAAWRYEISRRVEKIFYCFSTVKEKFRISVWPCNILYLAHTSTVYGSIPLL